MLKILILILGLLLSQFAFAQSNSQRNPCYSINGQSGSCISVGDITPLPVASSPLPSGAVSSVGNQVGNSGVISAQLAAVVGKTTYLCGLTYQSTNTTAPQNTVVAITGVAALTGGFVYPTLTIAATTPNPPPLTIPFSPCIPANAPNTPIAVTSSGAIGATASSIAAWGFTQ